MLVLTRKKSETIQIGENITVRVIRTGATTVKIGIDAPANVRILRGELSNQPLTSFSIKSVDSASSDPVGSSNSNILGRN